jgi:uncharacterized membrane protein YkvI
LGDPFVFTLPLSGVLLAFLFGSVFGPLRFARMISLIAPVLTLLVLVTYMIVPGNRLDQPYDRVFWLGAIVVTTCIWLLARTEPPRRLNFLLAGILGVVLGVPGWFWSSLFFLFAEAAPRGFRAMRPWDVFALAYSLFSFTVAASLLRVAIFRSTQTEARLL